MTSLGHNELINHGNPHQRLCIACPFRMRYGVSFVHSKSWLMMNTLRLRQSGCHFADNILKYISLNENFRILNADSLKYVPYDLIDNVAALMQKRYNSSVLAYELHPLSVNLLWPNDAIWWQKTESSLAQVMACCLTAPSHYLNQY